MFGGKKKYIGWLISFAFLALVFSKIEWREFLDALQNISPLDIPILCGIYLFGFLLRGVRSQLLLPALPFKDALGGVFVGYAANNVLPARLGEVVRAHVIGKHTGMKRTTAFSSVMVERIFDGAAIVALLIFGSGELTLPDWAEKARIGGLTLFSTALLGVIGVGITAAFWTKKLPDSKIGEALKGLVEGIALAVRDVKTTVLIVFSSLVIWTVESVMFYWGFHTFGFDLSFRAACFVMSIVNLGVLIPSSPGGLGVFQYFTLLSLNFLHAPASPAAAYALVIHFCQYVPITVIGLMWLPRFGIKELSAEGIRSATETPE